MLTEIFDGDFVNMQQLNNFLTIFITHIIYVAIGGPKRVGFPFFRSSCSCLMTFNLLDVRESTSSVFFALVHLLLDNVIGEFDNDGSRTTSQHLSFHFRL